MLIVSKWKWKNPIITTSFELSLSPPLLVSPASFFKKFVSPTYPIFYILHFFPFNKKWWGGRGGVEIMCIKLKIYEILFVSVCVFPLEHFDVSLMLYRLLYSISFFVKIFFRFYDQIKHKTGEKDSIIPTRKTNPWNSSNQTSLKGCSVSGKSKLLVGLHTLVIIEHSSGSVVSGLVLHYAKYKHT